MTQAAFDDLKKRWQDAERRVLDLSYKADLWDKLVESVAASMAADIEEKVSDAVEDAVSNLSIS